MSLTSQVNSALALFDHLFDDWRIGYLCITTAKRQSNNKLAEVKDTYFLWPNDRLMAAMLAIQAGISGLEVFFVSTLLKNKSRVKEAALAVGALFVDCDTPGAKPPPYVPMPTAIVESSPNKHHFYWKLDKAIEPQEAEKYNQRLAYAFGDKSGWDCTQLLRVPGTFNYKYAGNPAVLFDDPEDFIHSLCAFEDLPQVPQALALSDDDENEPPVLLDAAGLAVWRGEMPKLKPDGEIDKSETLCKVAHVLAENGATAKAIAAALADRDIAFGFEKYSSRQDGLKRYAEIARAAFNKAAFSRLPDAKPEAKTPAIQSVYTEQIELVSYKRLDIRRLLSGDDAETPPLVKGLLYPGMLTLVGAWVGIGKTSMAMSIITALLTGSKALDCLDVAPLNGPIIYFSELTQKGMAKTLRNAAAAYDVPQSLFYDNVQFLDMAGESVLDKTVASQFEYAIRGASLIVIDTFDAWMAGNPNETAPTLAAWNMLKNAATNGPAVLVLDHQSKNKPDQSKEQTAVGGNSAKQRFPDLVYRLDRSDGPDKFNILQPVKDRHGIAISLEIRKNDFDKLIGRITKG